MPRRTRIWPMEAETQAAIIALSTRSIDAPPCRRGPPGAIRPARAGAGGEPAALQVAERDPARAGGAQGGVDAGAEQRRQLRLVMVGGHLPVELRAAPD